MSPSPSAAPLHARSVFSGVFIVMVQGATLPTPREGQEGRVMIRGCHRAPRETEEMGGGGEGLRGGLVDRFKRTASKYKVFFWRGGGGGGGVDFLGC